MTDFTGRKDFGGRTVLVCGARVAGASAARALLALGAQVLVTDNGPASVAEALPAGAQFVGEITDLPPGVAAVVTSPGLRPDHPLLRKAAHAGIDVCGELEFAWRIRGEQAAPWLMVTGTNGKTTTVRMVESILRAAGLRALAVGNVGIPVIDAVMADEPYEALAVEASSFQLHHSSTIRPLAGVILNLAEDHLDWHGSMAGYAAEKTKVWAGWGAIGNADDPLVADLLRLSPAEHIRTFTLSEPDELQYGVRDGMLIDDAGRPLLRVSDIQPPGPHNVANALAAAALASTLAVSREIAAGLRGFIPDPHRNQHIATVNGVDYIDDSKATNPHAAAASLAAYENIVWIAGGQLKGAAVEDLVARFGPRLRAAVLLGADRDVIAAALTRHAPDLPVILVSSHDDGAMTEVVTAAASLAVAGDAVLLAPAAASLDMFNSYGARGLAFSEAVKRLAAEPSERA
jgi:UDP-N-acetylmuramoylalanine--D-glutamate ligase